MAEHQQLYLLRHADAGDPGAWRGDDAVRPLSGKGRRQAQRLGSLLAALGFEPDAILTSPKLRAAETAELVAAALGKKVEVDDRLGAGFGPESLAAIVAGVDGARRIVLVGHDPDFSDVLSRLVGAEIAMKKGALARVDLTGGIGPGSGVLRWLLPPDAVPGAVPGPGRA
jgi:phosphohistidine phosphatase